MENNTIPSYSQSGTVIAIAGLLGIIFAHFNIQTSQGDIATMIASFLTLYGLIKQGLHYHRTAVAAGAIK